MWVQRYNIISMPLLEKLHQSWLPLCLIPNLHHFHIDLTPALCEGMVFLGMYEVAAVTEEAATQLQEGATALGLVFTVGLLVLLQLVKPVSKLTPLLVRTASVLYESLAELRFLFVWGGRTTRGLLCRKGMREWFGKEEGRCGWCGIVSDEHWWLS